MPTFGDIALLAFRDSGVFGKGQTPTAEDYTNAMFRTNMMMSQWDSRRWLIYRLVDSFVTSTGAVSYTVGVGGDIDIARPDRIEAAYIRQVVVSNPTPIDWPLTLITSREDYSKIAIKTLRAAPSQYLFYDSDYPLGRIYPWPVPNTDQWEVHILTKAVLQQFENPSDNIELPPAYQQAIYLQMAVDMRMAYRMKPDPVMIGRAKAALATVRKANTQPSTLYMPRGLTRGPAYNPWSDMGGGY